jgi:hypothetical protein
MFYLRLRRRTKSEKASPPPALMPDASLPEHSISDDSIPDYSVPGESGSSKAVVTTKPARAHVVQPAAETCQPPGSFRTGTLHKSTFA